MLFNEFWSSSTFLYFEIASLGVGILCLTGCACGLRFYLQHIKNQKQIQQYKRNNKEFCLGEMNFTSIKPTKERHHFDLQTLYSGVTDLTSRNSIVTPYHPHPPARPSNAPPIHPQSFSVSRSSESQRNTEEYKESPPIVDFYVERTSSEIQKRERNSFRDFQKEFHRQSSHRIYNQPKFSFPSSTPIHEDSESELF
jgi:hypothetical protein